MQTIMDFPYVFTVGLLNIQSICYINSVSVDLIRNSVSLKLLVLSASTALISQEILLAKFNSVSYRTPLMFWSGRGVFYSPNTHSV